MRFIVAEFALGVCDGAHRLFVMKTGRRRTAGVKTPQRPTSRKTARRGAPGPRPPLRTERARMGHPVLSPEPTHSQRTRMSGAPGEELTCYRSAEALRHPKSRATQIPCATLPLNPTLAHRTRKDGAPVVRESAGVLLLSYPRVHC
jgi:hypothetical protein